VRSLYSRDAKPSQTNMTIAGQNQVRRLHVAMNHRRGIVFIVDQSVGICEGTEESVREIPNSLGRHSLMLASTMREQLREGDSGASFEHENQPVLMLKEVKYPDDIRVVEPGTYLGLVSKIGCERGISCRTWTRDKLEDAIALKAHWTIMRPQKQIDPAV